MYYFNFLNAEEDRGGEKKDLFSQLAALLLSQNPHGFSHIPRTSEGMEGALPKIKNK